MKKLDFHMHLSPGYPVEKSAANLQELCARHGYDAICLQTITHVDGEFIPHANETAAAVKKLLPGAFLFGCPDHNGTSYTDQAKRLVAGGVDGIKLLIGKPSEYRDLNVKLDDPIVDAFFAWAEQENVPVLLHNNDPDFHWDRTRMDPGSVARGWCYDSPGMPDHEYFNRSLEQLLAKYPNLRMAVAHMGFYSNKLERLTKLMETYPRLYMDITPALCIFEDLSAEPEKAKEFFCRFGDRIVYGTDGWSDLGENVDHRSLNDKKVKVIRHFLCGEGEAVIDGQRTVGIGLTPRQQEDVYYWNALRFMKKI